MKKTWLIISIFSLAEIMLSGIIYIILFFTNNLYVKEADSSLEYDYNLCKP